MSQPGTTPTRLIEPGFIDRIKSKSLLETDYIFLEWFFDMTYADICELFDVIIANKKPAYTVEGDAIIHLPDKSTFRCPDCGAMVFKKLIGYPVEHETDIAYRCNGCHSIYIGQE